MNPSFEQHLANRTRLAGFCEFLAGALLCVWYEYGAQSREAEFYEIYLDQAKDLLFLFDEVGRKLYPGVGPWADREANYFAAIKVSRDFLIQKKAQSELYFGFGRGSPRAVQHQRLATGLQTLLEFLREVAPLYREHSDAKRLIKDLRQFTMTAKGHRADNFKGPNNPYRFKKQASV